MIYLETFRHFIQEWIKLEHPVDDREWPWRRDRGLYVLNLYAYSSSDTFTKHPTPFITILINGIDFKEPIYDPTQALFKEYFEQEQYQLPRRYVFDPFKLGKSNIHMNRHSFSSNGYRIEDSSGADSRLRNIIAHRPHVRRSIYSSQRYDIIRTSLDELAAASNATVYTAENLFDCTEEASQNSHTSPDLMLIQAPIIGLVYPIGKSHTYRIINGAFVLCKDPVRLAIPGEPCYDEYQKVMTPFSHLSRYSFMGIRGQVGTAKAVVYIAVEAPNGSFSFQEYIPGNVMTSAMGDEYAHMLTHSFINAPAATVNAHSSYQWMYVYLRHNIDEGLIQVTPEHKRFLVAQNEKIFKRADLPDGYYKSPGGATVSVALP